MGLTICPSASKLQRELKILLFPENERKGIHIGLKSANPANSKGTFQVHISSDGSLRLPRSELGQPILYQRGKFTRHCPAASLGCRVASESLKRNIVIACQLTKPLCRSPAPFRGRTADMNKHLHHTRCHDSPVFGVRFSP